jgi:hypothetical protein
MDGLGLGNGLYSDLQLGGLTFQGIDGGRGQIGAAGGLVTQMAFQGGS